MAIDLYDKKEETPTWKKILLIFSILTFLTIGGILIYYQFIRIPRNLDQIDTIKKELNAQGTAEQLSQKGLVLAAESKIDEFKEIYYESPVFEKFFEEFEGSIYPRVSFSQMDLNIETGELVLSASTDSLQSIMQQMTMLDEEDNIQSYTISGISISAEGGEVLFNLVLKLNKNIFLRQNV